MDFRKNETERAINLLKLYKSQLNKPDEKSLRKAMDKLIESLDSPLFNALLDIQEFYEHSLNYNQNVTKIVPENVVEVNAEPQEKPKDKLKKKKKSSRSQKEETPFPTEVTSPVQYEEEPVRGDQYYQDQVDDYQNGAEQDLEQNPWEFHEIELDKGNNGYGFGIAGGYDKEHYPGDPGIFVTKIISNGSAEVDGRLRIDDVVVMVNDTNLDNVAHATAVDTLKSCGKHMRLVIRRLRDDYYANQAGYEEQGMVEQEGAVGGGDQYQEEAEFINFEIVLKKRSKGGLGFSIQGGYDPQNPEEDTFLSVSRITPGGVAEQDGRLVVGDVLLNVNDDSLNGLTHEDAVNMLKNTGQEVKLLIGRFVPRQEEQVPVEKTEKKKKKKHRKDRHEE